MLKRMTDVFKKYDDDRDGYITLSFEEFLTGGFPSPFFRFFFSLFFFVGGWWSERAGWVFA